MDDAPSLDRVGVIISKIGATEVPTDADGGL